MAAYLIEGIPFHIDYADLYVGRDIGHSDWFPITQERINQFGEATEDYNPLHIDPDWAAANGPFGGPVAHGFYTLSLLSHLGWNAGFQPDGVDYGLNLGFDRVRFLAPVLIGDEVRMRSHLQEVIKRGSDKWQMRSRVVLETRKTEKAALNAVWITLLVSDPEATAFAYRGGRPDGYVPLSERARQEAAKTSA